MKRSSKSTMERRMILLLLVVCYVTMTYSQQCRQVMTTVCDDEVSNSRMQKGDKGDTGRSGKAGSPEVNGEVGEKGMQGDSCALGSLGTDIISRLAKIEKLLSPPSTTTTTTTIVATTSASRVTSCATSSSNGDQVLTSGVEVYCEDGWTVFQRRIDGTVSFQRGWDDYANGFGQVDGEFWLGLHNIHEMTRGGGCRLKIELWDFDGNQRHANYSSFSVDSAEKSYRLLISGYSGNAGDGMSYHNNKPFSAWDRDNDLHRTLNCASHYGGNQGWWFGDCLASSSALNGVWMRESTGTAHGVVWELWKGWHEPLKATNMKFRCD
ncbi:microfibril-associated glycoprotein 4-like [Clavelina lepadiformis]|uniref:microfibril-associated glycoprotein 4-like n=1 Tax=Clavelina lepadiformis TaxID=159417 RepID=UPI0040437E36